MVLLLKELILLAPQLLVKEFVKKIANHEAGKNFHKKITISFSYKHT